MHRRRVPETTVAKPRALRARYEPVLRARQARLPIAGNLLGLLGTAGIALAILLAVHATYGSFGIAGAVVGSSTGAVAIGRITQGRLMDRHGLRAVLVPLAWLQMVAFAGLTLAIGARVPVAPLLGLGVLAGAVQPAVSTAMRTLWTTLVPDVDERAAAFAFDTTVSEISLIGAPVLVGALVAIFSPELALLTLSALMAAGALLLAGSNAARAHVAERPATSSAGARPLWRALVGSTGITLVLAVAFGVVEVAIPAFATAHRTPGATGVLLAMWSVGSVAGGVCFGVLRQRGTSELRLLGCLVAFSLAAVPLALATSLLGLGSLLLVAGLPIAPSLTMIFVITDERAPQGRSTEAFGWVSSALMGGSACGAALAGWIVAERGASASFVVAAVLGGVAAALAAVGQRSRSRSARESAEAASC